MSRRKPVIVASNVNSKSYKSTQVLKADAVFAVYFDDHPINIRILHTLLDYPGPKYKTSSFPNEGHAFYLAGKLNTLFKTDRFSVYKLTIGEKLLRKNGT